MLFGNVIAHSYEHYEKPIVFFFLFLDKYSSLGIDHISRGKKKSQGFLQQFLHLVKASRISFTIILRIIRVLYFFIILKENYVMYIPSLCPPQIV
jgi:hypothetical protein